MHYVYVLQALDDRTVFYLGFSSNLKQRVKRTMRELTYRQPDIDGVWCITKRI